jgi:tripartite-type tricarboxylate transporter receptor subunit TctC
MTHQSRVTLTLLCWLLMLYTRSPMAADFTPARTAVYFSPNGGATDAVAREVNAAKTQILVQAYSFTSAPIAKALMEAHKRGVHVLAVLDTSNETAGGVLNVEIHYSIELLSRCFDGSKTSGLSNHLHF